MFVTNTFQENNLRQTYTNLSGGKFANLPLPISFVPQPELTDIYVLRYFVKRANDFFIYEVAETNYDNLLSSNFYVGISINWQVRGISNTTNDPINGATQGVAEYNQEQLEKAEATLPGLSKKLINLLDLYQGA